MSTKSKSAFLSQPRCVHLLRQLVVLILMADPIMNQGVENDQEQKVFPRFTAPNGAAPVFDINVLRNALQTLPLDTQNGDQMDIHQQIPPPTARNQHLLGQPGPIEKLNVALRELREQITERDQLFHEERLEMRGHVEEVRRQIETSVQQAFGQVGRIEELQEQIREQGRQLHEMREQIREQGQQLHEENLEMRGRLICGCLIC